MVTLGVTLGVRVTDSTIEAVSVGVCESDAHCVPDWLSVLAPLVDCVSVDDVVCEGVTVKVEDCVDELVASWLNDTDSVGLFVPVGVCDCEKVLS